MALNLNQQSQVRTTSQKSSSSTPPTGDFSAWQEFVAAMRSIALFLAIAFILRASVVEAFKIPSSSMEPTLEIGDHILVNKLSYGLRLPFLEKSIMHFREPQRGDIVVFTLPDDASTPDTYEPDTNIIKRVMGLPGDKIEVRGMSVYINDKLYENDDTYARWLEGGKKNFGPVTVPPGHVLMLGDNRDHSKDSRYWSDPFLEISRIKGRAFVIYWNSQFMLGRLFTIIR